MSALISGEPWEFQVIKMNWQKKKSTSESAKFQTYLNGIIHEWLKTLTIVAGTLIPLFLVLDYFTVPDQHRAQFAIYRGITTAGVLLLFLILKFTRPSKYSYIHGYVINLIVGLMIIIMTSDLGGFSSGYYSGLNLIIVAGNVLTPWQAIHSLINGSLTVILYVIINFIIPHEFQVKDLINNLYFLSSMVVISVSISYVRSKLIKQEFGLRSEVEDTRDALWGEMEIAKKIQTALLPNKRKIGNYEIASMMVPADEVGGDYFDIIETKSGKLWVGIGDVSGHGVESGLIMMMAQTSIATAINLREDAKPSTILEQVNLTLKENISRLDVDRYMTLSLLQLEDSYLITAGRHQDLYIYRFKTRQIEKISVKGTWIGVSDDIQHSNANVIIPVGRDDVIFLYTDGLTEATDKNREMFGVNRLTQLFQKYGEYPVNEIIEKIYNDLKQFQVHQSDDITLVILRNTFKWYSSKQNLISKLTSGGTLWKQN